MKTTKSIKSQNKRHDEYVSAVKRVEVATANLKKIEAEMLKSHQDFAIASARIFVDKSEGLAEATKEIGVARDALLKILNK